MDAVAETALRESIEKWRQKAVATNISEVLLGPKTCPLCTFYWHNGCHGCPVFARTGQAACVGTAYYSVLAAKSAWYKAELFDTAARDQAVSDFQIYAQEEVEFLESLLPENQVPAVGESG